MNNGVGVPQSIVLFGGTSDIGLATLERLVRTGMSRLVLVSRDVEEANRRVQPLVGGHPEIEVHHVAYDARDADGCIEAVNAAVRHAGDIDLAIVAQGVLAEDDFYSHPVAALDMIDVNYRSAVVLLYAIAARMRAQGFGKIVLLSSVAGERVRRSNAVYGSTKSGVDSFALALDHDLRGTGASILVVRPGFVESKMTIGMPKVPFSTTPERVAAAVEKGIRSSALVVWVPGILRWVFSIFRHLPTSLWRRLPI